MNANKNLTKEELKEVMLYMYEKKVPQSIVYSLDYYKNMRNTADFAFWKLNKEWNKFKELIIKAFKKTKSFK